MDSKVYWGDKVLCSLNRSLITTQNLSDEQVSNIKRLTKFRELFEERMQASKDKFTVDLLYRAWLANEYEIQAAWGFPSNSNYFRPWLIPACSCPYKDNEDSYPSGWVWVSGSCKIHGQSS